MFETSIETLSHELASVKSYEIAALQLEQASLLLLDTIGCAIAGRQDHGAATVVSTVTTWGGAQDCQIIGHQLRTNAANAILANGALLRALDLNDYVFRVEGSQTRLGGHPSDNNPVALAFAELAKTSGRALLEAIVIGYEMFGRAKAFSVDAGEWDGVSYSGLVVPAIACRLLQLSEKQTADAMAISLARCATSAMVRTGHISSAKSIANALVAKSSAEAVLLAAGGVSGPIGVLDHKRGMRSLFSNAQALEALVQPIKNPSYIMSARIKPFPCVGTAQCAVEAAIQLNRKLHGDLSGVHKLRLEMGDHPTVIRHLADTERANPTSREAADHSIPFLVAVAALDGELGMRQFANARWNDARVRDLMAKIETHTDEGLRHRSPENFACRIEAFTDAGSCSSEVLAPPGWSREGIVKEAVLSKFHRVTRDALPEVTRERIVEAVVSLADTQNVTHLAAALAT
ncbi:MAG: MmgE/PrpD family protein [Beijerinckiaceae bacterium]|nr:MmgE/PrpD family protein [Beijerinckiaceae bacterium]